MIIHDTECPYQVSLNNTNQTWIYNHDRATPGPLPQHTHTNKRKKTGGWAEKVGRLSLSWKYVSSSIRQLINTSLTGKKERPEEWAWASRVGLRPPGSNWGHQCIVGPSLIRTKNCIFIGCLPHTTAFTVECVTGWYKQTRKSANVWVW